MPMAWARTTCSTRWRSAHPRARPSSPTSRARSSARGRQPRSLTVKLLLKGIPRRQQEADLQFSIRKAQLREEHAVPDSGVSFLWVHESHQSKAEAQGQMAVHTRRGGLVLYCGHHAGGCPRRRYLLHHANNRARTGRCFASRPSKTGVHGSARLERKPNCSARFQASRSMRNWSAPTRFRTHSAEGSDPWTLASNCNQSRIRAHVR
jgi:hypothetical protein